MLGDKRYPYQLSLLSFHASPPPPEIIPIGLGQTVEEEGLKVTALPANHASNFVEEETLIYLIEKDSTRLLYATDTGGLTARAAGYAGIGQFSRSRKFLTGIRAASS